MAVGDRAMLELPFARATRFPRNGRLDHIVIVGSHFLMQALQRVLQMPCLQTVPRILAHHPTRLRRGCRSPRRMRSSSTARQASVLSMKARLQCIVTKWADLTIKAVADGASYAAEVTIELAEIRQIDRRARSTNASSSSRKPEPFFLALLQQA